MSLAQHAQGQDPRLHIQLVRHAPRSSSHQALRTRHHNGHQQHVRSTQTPGGHMLPPRNTPGTSRRPRSVLIGDRERRGG